MPTLKSLVLESFLENKERRHLGVTQMCHFLNNGMVVWASQVALVERNSPASAGDLSNVGSIPGSGRFPRRRPRQPTPVCMCWWCSAEDLTGLLCKSPELAFWPPSPPWHSALQTPAALPFPNSQLRETPRHSPGPQSSKCSLRTPCLISPSARDRCPTLPAIHCLTAAVFYVLSSFVGA